MLLYHDLNLFESQFGLYHLISPHHFVVALLSSVQRSADSVALDVAELENALNFWSNQVSKFSIVQTFRHAYSLAQRLFIAGQLLLNVNYWCSLGLSEMVGEVIDGIESGLMNIILLLGRPVELLGEFDWAFGSGVDWKFRIYRGIIFCVPEIDVVVLLRLPRLLQSYGLGHKVSLVSLRLYEA